jgi:hypothetical protein
MKFLCRKREASNFVKFQERNSGKENCKELPSTKLHLSNLHSSDRKAKNFHPRNSTQVSLGDEERRPTQKLHLGNFSAERWKPANPLNSKKGIPRRSRSTARNFHPGNST